MDNDIFKSQKNEDEYHFSETDNTSAFTGGSGAVGETTGKPHIFERINRKNLIIAVVVVLTVLSVYKLTSVLFTSNHARDHIRSVNSTPKITPPLQAKNSTAPVIAQNTMQNNIPVAANSINTRLTALETHDIKLQSSADKLSSQLSDLQNSIANIDSRVSSLSQNIQDMTNKQDQFIKQQEEKKKLLQKRSQRPVLAKSIPIYYVKAVIPGRAWLSTQGKSLVTVSIGDNLPGYGIIESIDTTQGLITTSSGAIIGYDPENS